MTQALPACSSSTDPPTYDAFLNFRGSDTRIGFANNLKKALRERGFHPFFDEEGLDTGDVIKPTLVEAIRKSKMAITIFSPRYLESKACLMELTEFSNCMSDGFILPIFYDIEPKKLRDDSEAIEMKEEWRSALKNTTRIKGWSFKTDGQVREHQCIEEVVDKVSKILDRPSNTVDNRVGLKSRVEEVCLLLNGESDDRVNIVGICGMGGIGKTTLACAVYNTLACQYKYLYFLSSVREKSSEVDGLAKLQQELLSKIFGENDKKHPTETLQSRLKTQKLLLVIDDVDNRQQLKALALREWFFPGSKIIITTRNKKPLEYHGVKSIYEVKELNEGEARKLLCLHAFGKSEVGPEYIGVLNEAVYFAKGHPLVLEALGSTLHGLTVEEWGSALEIYARNPSRLQWSDKDIQKILEVSYDGLTKDEKEIFLDIVCFYKGYLLEYVKNRLCYSHGFNPEYCIRVLFDKFFIKIGQDGRLKMHDLYEDMGKEIVRQQSNSELGRCSRLWSTEDILHILKYNTGTGKIQVIKLSESFPRTIEWSGDAFQKMQHLRELSIIGGYTTTEPKYLPNSLRVLKWSSYPSSSLPSGFDPANLVILDLSSCPIDSTIPLQKCKNLRELNLSSCDCLTEVSTMSGYSKLKKLILNDCENLREIDNSIGSLLHLEELRAGDCHNLEIIPYVINLPSLEILVLGGCWKLKYFPEISVEMKKIKTVDFSYTGIEGLPKSIEKLIGLECLLLSNWEMLRWLPLYSILKLAKLVRLEAGLCTALNWWEIEQERSDNYPKLQQLTEVDLSRNGYISDEFLPTLVRWFPNLTILKLSGNKFTVLPEFFARCFSLKQLYLDSSDQLQEIKGIPPNIERFSLVNCTSLNSESSKLLLNQNIHDARNKEFILPGKQIPEWFQQSNTSDSVSFWFRDKFPDIAVCLLVHLKDPDENRRSYTGAEYISFSVLVNGTHQHRAWMHRFKDLIPPQEDHIYLVDLTSLIEKLELQMEQSKCEWNHVQISYAYFSRYLAPYGVIKYNGVYLYNYRSYKGDISFKDPSSSKRTPDDVDYNSNTTTSENANDIQTNNDANESEEEPSVTRINEKEQKLKKQARKKEDINLSWASASSAPRCTNRREDQQDLPPINPIIIIEDEEEKEEEKGKETKAKEEGDTKSNEESAEEGNLCIVPSVPRNLPSTPSLEAEVSQRDSCPKSSEHFNQDEDQENEDGKKWVINPKKRAAHAVEDGGATKRQKEAQEKLDALVVQQASNSPQGDKIEDLSARVTKLESEVVELKQLVLDVHRMVIDQFANLSKLISGFASSSQPQNH